VNAVDNYPSTTIWDVGSSVGALVSAFELPVGFSYPAVDLLVTLAAVAFVLWSLVRRRGQLGYSMRRETVPFPQLRFLLRLSLGDVVAQHPGAEADRLPAVAQPVDRERLRQSPGTGR